MDLPKKLKKDSLLEVVCEIRFDANEIPEMTIGKLVSIPSLKGYASNRTAFADIPAPIRMQDEQLKYQALMHFTCPENKIEVKVGNNVISYNNIREYKGWEIYFPEIQAFLKDAFERLNPIKVTRIGLRYINALDPKNHLIHKINDLNLKVHVADRDVNERFNLNYVRALSENHETTVRVSTAEFVTGIPQEAIALVDLDIYTTDTSAVQGVDQVLDWINKAHDFEKSEFFSLIPKAILDKIREN